MIGGWERDSDMERQGVKYEREKERERERCVRACEERKKRERQGAAKEHDTTTLIRRPAKGGRMQGPETKKDNIFGSVGNCPRRCCSASRKHF
jgi:hypothetical protein